MSKKKHTPTLEEIYRGIDPPSEEELVSGKIPKELQLKRDEPGICFGKKSKKFPSHYIGVSQAAESNCIVIGGAGSNKTVGVAMTTLQTWQGAMVVTDVKGELSDYYKELYLNGLVDRPPLVFDLMDVEGISYDPFKLVEEEGKANVVPKCSEADYQYTSMPVPRIYRSVRFSFPVLRGFAGYCPLRERRNSMMPCVLHGCRLHRKYL